MLTMPKDSVTAAGNALGLKANSLAALLNLPASEMKTDMGSEWAKVLPVVLNPFNMATIITLINDEPEYLTVLTKDTDTAVCGMTGETFTAKLFILPEIVIDLARRLGQVPPQAPAIRQDLSADAIVTIFCVVDHIKRSRLEALLDPDRELFAVTERMIAARFADIQEKDDIRWLSALAVHLRLGVPPDFAKGISELVAAGLLTRDGELLDLTEESSLFFCELAESKIVLGINSIFYAERNLNCQPLMLIRTPLFLWYCDLSNNGVFASVTLERAVCMLAETLSPGEEVPVFSPAVGGKPAIPSPVVSPPTSGGVRTCPSCGTANTGKFCRNCGKKLVETALSSAAEPPAYKPICPKCGNAVAMGARFCKRCGMKLYEWQAGN